MAKKRMFQIRSKKDAKYLAEEIKHYGVSFYYYVPLMGISGGMMTIRCSPDQQNYTIVSCASGWQEDTETSMKDMIDYIWKDRKLINEELRYSHYA
ncbi:MAG: hypothetical protein KJN62_01780 [Deltaproteobacteria bacterium]|nr:hypothetical protein [Deltaproteobacteria bacterium]